VADQDLAPARPSRPRLRRRAVAVGLVFAMMSGSGVLLDRVVGPVASAKGSPEDEAAGAWFCPHGGGLEWKGWVAIANPGSSSVQARITTFESTGSRRSAVFRIPPSRQVIREVSALDPAASTEVEYFGGWVGAAVIIQSGGDHPSIAAERCAAAPHAFWFMPDDTTGPDQGANVVVMNPFAIDAAFDLIIRTEQRIIRPGPLSPYVLPAGRSVSIRLNQYALAAPGENTVTAEVEVKGGRAIAGSLATTPTGVRAEAGIALPGDRAILPASGYLGASQVAAMDPGRRRADLAPLAQSDTTQQPIVGPEGISLPPGGVRTFPDGGLPNAGVDIQSTNRVPVAVARRLEGQKGDQATITAAGRAYRSWLLLPTMPPSGGTATIVIQNPGRKDASGTILLIGSKGPVGAGDVATFHVPGRRTITVSLSSAGRGPLSAVVAAKGGTVVVAGASYSLGGSGYAATLAVPMGSG
jgi:uncharacterized protein DUF5719